MTHVAYLSADPGVPAFGTKGASVHVQEIIRAFRDRGASVRLYTARTDDHVPADLTDVPVTHVPVDSRAERTADKEFDQQERTARREQRQVAAAHEMATRAIADGVDIAYERYSLFSTALAEVTTTLGIPGVLEVNAPLIDEQATHRHLIDAAGALRALRTQVAAAAVVACVSEPVAQWVRGHCPEATDKIKVTPNGVNTSRIAPTTVSAEGDPIVLFVGTLKPWHGVEVLLEAAALAREPWQLRIVGDGPQGPALTEQAERLGLDVDFRGAVAPGDIPAALAGAAVSVAPYPVFDGGADQYFSPLKIYEYAAAGLPVVASRVGQVPGIVADGENGLLVEPSDPVALAAAIDTLAADPQRARALGLAGRDMVLASHSWDSVLDQILEDVVMPTAQDLTAQDSTAQDSIAQDEVLA
ncbi:glycosyltransferase family 4 protein [Ornithinimicrobium faecis]|uniref:Glycosyltransferase family 4 protein n=1 Tax=Ornithinimicrobium faecis TaxID=2934158 RepID=A0ABY4YZL0_9MICO|nr:glycosyltransferase family 4 protein [Ornithinimicrobium sp. HY1793]USQ81964.1 glycosyltransferase family 4 protein [Ornithinimicrobium sp. HY1793]